MWWLVAVGVGIWLTAAAFLVVFVRGGTSSTYPSPPEREKAAPGTDRSHEAQS